MLFANSTWESATPYPGWDCAIRWDVFGTINEPKFLACSNWPLEFYFNINPGSQVQLH